MSRPRRSRRSRRASANRSRIFRRLNRPIRRLRTRLPGVAITAARAVLIAALPFFLLVNGSVLSHRFLGTPGWISIALGCAMATAFVAFWGARLWHRMTGRARLLEISRNVALPIVLGFCIYSLGWFSSFNAKSPHIRDLYKDLHPTLRLAIGTATLTDPDVVITEISRKRTDYKRMGLASIENSLHFEQEDGWIHAVDIRTRGRSELRNWLSQIYFRAMGFRVLRHGGTGDHLHVALPRPRK